MKIHYKQCIIIKLICITIILVYFFIFIALAFWSVECKENNNRCIHLHVYSFYFYSVSYIKIKKLIFLHSLSVVWSNFVMFFYLINEILQFINVFLTWMFKRKIIFLNLNSTIINFLVSKLLINNLQLFKEKELFFLILLKIKNAKLQ